MSRRRAIAAVLLALAVLAAAVAGGFVLYSRQLYRDSYDSDYRYAVRIAPSAPVSNVTVLVPLPTVDGESVVDGAALDHPFTPEGWSADVVDTAFGPMLRVRADAVPTAPTYHRHVVEDDRPVRWEPIPTGAYDPANASHLRVDHDRVEVDVTVGSERSIDTRSPVGREPLLAPHDDRAETPCAWPGGESATCYAYTGRVFLSYEAADDTAVAVSVELVGANSWRVFGWSGNEYTDRQTVEVVGPRDDWVATDGDLRTGQGSDRAPPRRVPRPRESPPRLGPVAP